MKTSLKLEELGQFVFGIFLFTQLSFAWWWFLALILLPDIGMIGYLINSKAGALLYNLFHHKGIALAILIAGVYYQMEYLELAGVILFAHSAMDRLFGYGLKYPDSFSNTHLGKVGKEK
mgnify:CR=1 FL=1|tara:strand:+ start:33142 stop:33498 length:357 start_codon:yes stop_codon:yes gene_type:complete